MKILLITHQLDFSGAPLALLNLSKVLIYQKHSLVLASLKNGPLIDSFLKLGIEPFDPNKHMDDNFDIIIANTTPSVPHAVRFTKNPKKIVAWLHESQFYFNKWNATPKDFQIDKVGLILTLTNFQIEFLKYHLVSDSNIYKLNNYIEPLDLVNSNNKKIKIEFGDYWVCCGNWGKPKGQDKLINILKELNLTPRMVFIGAQKPLNIDVENYIFTGPVDYQVSRNLISNSLGLISNSIAEVQPLSILEALSSGKPVLLSKINAHIELKQLFNKIEIFEPESNHSFLNSFNKCTSYINDANYIDLQLDIMNQNFGFDVFSTNVITFIDKIKDKLI